MTPTAPAPGAERGRAARARWWRADGGRVICDLCPHVCRLDDREAGACGVRRNAGGELVTDAYGAVAVARPAPLERAFLYHVAPGKRAYAYAAPGCNLRCRFCQNWMVSQAGKDGAPGVVAGRELAPEALVAEALAAGCEAVACTYTEPTIFLEYALAVAAEARAAGLLHVWKTNGHIGEGAQAEAIPTLDAVNVDLKTFDDDSYRSVMGGRLQPVLDALRRFRDGGVWIEVTTLVIPGVNDSPAELDAAARFLLDELGPDTPWHLNRFHPDYELRHLPPTPPDTLHRARERALALGLRHVYTDVEPRGRGWDTACPGCGERVIERAQYRSLEVRLQPGDGAGRCPTCGTVLPGVAARGRR